MSDDEKRFLGFAPIKREGGIYSDDPNIQKIIEENYRLREENARLRRLVKTAYAEGCYDSTKTEKTQEEFEALWRRTFSYKIISGRGKDEAP